jgi:hypothetical protein
VSENEKWSIEVIIKTFNIIKTQIYIKDKIWNKNPVSFMLKAVQKTGENGFKAWHE